MIPTLEKSGGTLWYAVPYEGFEASDHVVYTHACPNQHLLPLLDWAMPAHGRRGLSDRIELHLGLGDEPPGARADHGGGRARCWASATCPSGRATSGG